jgi:hypothetical protein
VTRKRSDSVIALACYLAALALDVWLVFVLPQGSWQDHAGLLFGIIGIFAFATGFLKETDLVKQLPGSFLDDLTSPDLFQFLTGNLRLLATSTDFAQAFLWGRNPWTRWGSGRKFALFPYLLLYTIAVLLLALLWIVALAAYLIFVVPFSYLAYALVSLPLDRISKTDETKWKPINPYGLEPRKVARDHTFQLRVFGVASLATFGLVVVKVISLY